MLFNQRARSLLDLTSPRMKMFGRHSEGNIPLLGCENRLLLLCSSSKVRARHRRRLETPLRGTRRLPKDRGQPAHLPVIRGVALSLCRPLARQPRALRDDLGRQPSFLGVEPVQR